MSAVICIMLKVNEFYRFIGKNNATEEVKRVFQ